MSNIQSENFLPPTKAKGMLISLLTDFIDNDAESLIDYLNHVGFDISALSETKDLVPAWFGHYRIGQGTYDTDRAAMDLLTWPPMSRYVFNLQAEKQGLAK